MVLSYMQGSVPRLLRSFLRRYAMSKAVSSEAALLRLGLHLRAMPAPSKSLRCSAPDLG